MDDITLQMGKTYTFNIFCRDIAYILKKKHMDDNLDHGQAWINWGLPNW
jgi:hypothetical protein